jgi:ribosome biogenesis protein NSA2
MERHKKLHGVRMDQLERDRKREARRAHKLSAFAQKSFGLRAKMFNQKRFKEKAALRKTLAMHQEGSNKHASDDKLPNGIPNRFLTRHSCKLYVCFAQTPFQHTSWIERESPEPKYYPTR